MWLNSPRPARRKSPCSDASRRRLRWRLRSLLHSWLGSVLNTIERLLPTTGGAGVGESVGQEEKGPGTSGRRKGVRVEGGREEAGKSGGT